MSVQVLQREPDRLQAMIDQIFAQSEARRMERERLAQQQSQFAQTFDLEKQQTAAQIAAQNAMASASSAQGDESRYKVASDRAGLVTAPIIKNYEAILNNAGPERAAQYMAGAASRIGDDAEVQNRLRGYLETRPSLPMDATNANLAQFAADTTGRVTAGGQNAMDVNLATKLLTGDQLSAPAFGNQDTREFGTDALRSAVSIADDRTAGATPKLQSSTAIQVGREGNASAERIAAMRLAADMQAANAKAGGSAGGRAERNANLAADGVALIDDLMTHEGFSDAVGAKGFPELFGLKPGEPFGGTKAASFAAKLERLRSLTTLPNLELMRGLGAMSEKEMELVRASAGALSRNVDEVEFRKELERMRPVLEKASKVIEFGANVGVPQTQPGETFKAPDGRVLRKVQGGWVEVE